MRKCKNCGNENIEIISKPAGYFCGRCGRNSMRMDDLKSETNADRIRGMCDEELAEWIFNIEHFKDYEGRAYEGKSMLRIFNSDTRQIDEIRNDGNAILDWLESEVSE